MRFLHTADWHIGKKLYGYDLLEDQRYILDQILALVENQSVDAIVVAGDLYDRSVPAVEAVKLMNQTLETINLKKEIPLLAISGNHDSATRLETGTSWYKKTAFHLHTTLKESLEPVEIDDVQFFLLPYFEPIEARLYFKEPLMTIAQSVARVVLEMQKRFASDKKQVLVSHFFAAGSLRTESETQITVGGLNSVPLEVFEVFDYTALGHLHSKNALHHEKIRYSGSPLKFSLSEINDQKGVYIIDSQTMAAEFYPLTPLREVHQYTASFQELLAPEFYNSIDRESFLQFTLTDQAIIPNMMNQLRKVYPNILGVERLAVKKERIDLKKIQKSKDPQQMIEAFFKEITGETLDSQQVQWLEKGLTFANRQEQGGQNPCSREN